MSVPAGRSSFRLWTVALSVLTIISFAPAMTGPFIYDDRLTILGNPSAQELSMAFSPRAGTAVSGRPVANATLVLNHQLNAAMGVDPNGPNRTVGYHVLNVLLHLCCGLLLIGLVRRTVRHQAYRPDLKPYADTIAMAIGAAWLVHPIQTEAVNYIIQRTEILMGLCYLATLYASVRAWDAATPDRSRAWLATAVATCLLGMGSKESMASAPFMVLLYDRAFRVRSWAALKQRAWFYGALGLTLIPLAAAVITNSRNGTVGFGIGMPWYRYLYSQAWAILHYLSLVVWPAGLTIDYGIEPVTGWSGIPGLVVLSLLFAGTIIAWTRPARWGWAAFLGSWFFLILAPSSSVVPILTEVAAERRMYLPLVAVLVAIGAGLSWIAGRAGPWARRSKLAAPAAAGIILVFAAVTFSRSTVYRSPERLWRDAMVKRPGNSRAIGNLAGVYMQEKPARIAEAESLYWQALRVDTLYTPALEHLADIAGLQGRVYDQHALLLRRVNLPPRRAEPYRSLGDLLVANGNVESGIGYLETAVQISPTDESFVALGRAYVAANRLAEGSAAFERALAVNGNRLDAMQLLGHTLALTGHASDAIAVLGEARRRAPANPRTEAFLVEAFAAAGNADSALAASRLVNQANGDLLSLQITAGALLHVGLAREAERFYTAILDRGPGDPAVLTGLAEALVQQGRRREALARVRQALALHPTYEPALQLLRKLE